jgi:hypothetical protein
MGQSTVELPDPLQSTGPEPGAAKSADDLLSQLAGDEIDRLLAENESEPTAAAPAAPDGAPSPAAVPAAVDLDAVLKTAAADRSPPAEKQALHAPASQPVAKLDNSPQIELGPAPKRLPLFLRPLEWLSSPLDPWPDQFRDILGKAGLITLINALAVLAYVLLFRKHHG